MIYTDLTRKAMKISYAAHAGQVDKAGVPYICHPLHVAESMTSETATAVALLHDVIEDTPWTGELLRAEGFPEEVVAAVELLTRDEELPYANYLQRLAASGNRIALQVKYADVIHNSDESRFIGGKQPNHMRERYKMAREIIEDALKKAEHGEPQGGTN